MADMYTNLALARIKAAQWHREKRIEREQSARNEAEKVLSGIALEDPRNAELSLAFLYLGEGNKTPGKMGLGSSNLKILNFYLTALEHVYSFPREKHSYGLHIRFDQNADKLKGYWSKALSIPCERLMHVNIDPRTQGRSTRAGYFGVCQVSGGTVEIQRRLMYLADTFIERYCAVSSVGRARH